MAALSAKEEKLLEAYLSGTLGAGLSDPDVYAALQKALTGRAFPEQVQAALNLGKRNAATLPVRMSAAELDTLGTRIAEGIVSGMHPTQTARTLDMVTKLTEQGEAQWRKYGEKLKAANPTMPAKAYTEKMTRRYQQLLNQRRRVIAHTEQNYAHSEGSRLREVAQGARHKVWITSQDGRVSDKCQANEAQGWIPVTEAFSSGDQVPPAHPVCRCAVTYRDEKPNSAAQDRAKARAGKTAAAKES